MLAAKCHLANGSHGSGTVLNRRASKMKNADYVRAAREIARAVVGKDTQGAAKQLRDIMNDEFKASCDAVVKSNNKLLASNKSLEASVTTLNDTMKQVVAALNKK